MPASGWVPGPTREMARANPDLFGAIPKDKKSNKKRMTVMDKIKIFEGSVGNESEKKSKERSSNKGENYKSTSVCVGPDRKRLPGW